MSTKRHAIVGIDPGLDGGLSVLNGDGTVALVRTMPTTPAGKGREVDADTLSLQILAYRPRLAVVEKVHAMPKQGVTSTFNFGVGYGVVLGVLGTLGIPTELVTPQGWKKLVLAGTARDKAAAVAYCKRRWPGVELRKSSRATTDHDGMADSLCLAEFGRRLLNGGKP